MNISRFLLTALALLALTFHASMFPAQATAAAPATAPDPKPSEVKFPSDYRIDPENVLQIDVYYGKGEKSSQRVRVSSSGTITLSYIGDVPVAGLTVPELQKNLNKIFDKGEAVPPQATVSVEEYSMVTIIGEIKKAGAYPIKSSMSVVELIALAEGFNENASPNEVKVIHTNPDGTKTPSIVKVYDIMNKSSGENENLLLRSRDVVIVPQSTVTIIGEVMKPGIYPTRGHLTIIDLIALAEGFTKFADRNEIKVIHTNPDETKTERIVPLYEIMNKGSINNEGLLLYSGDVVFVR